MRRVGRCGDELARQTQRLAVDEFGGCAVQIFLQRRPNAEENQWQKVGPSARWVCGPQRGLQLAMKTLYQAIALRMVTGGADAIAAQQPGQFTPQTRLKLSTAIGGDT